MRFVIDDVFLLVVGTVLWCLVAGSVWVLLYAYGRAMRDSAVSGEL